MVKKVLILDNDLGILEVMEEILVYEGFEVNTLESTKDIISTIKQYQPNVFITDYNLNGINGGELCKTIKLNPVTSHTPVIIFSAYSSKVLQSWEQYGCDAFVSKPFDLTEMTDLIKNLAENHLKLGINSKFIGY